MIDLTNFNWGWMDESYISKDGDILYHYNSDGTIEELSDYHKRCIIQEIFNNHLYEKFFEVEPNDVVVDIGSSIGPFTYSILHNKNR